ncbi:FxSxx-COOH system tetratricopeptide repeat protein, partial [Nocardia takedensis]
MVIATEGGPAPGMVVTGDGVQVVQVPAEAWRPITEIDAPAGIDNLPLLPGVFVGRASELARLDTVLAAPGQVVVQAVHGLGGVGKSTLVAQWAATRDGEYSPVRWITAESATAVEQGLADLADALHPALAQAFPVEQRAEKAVQWLATHTGWMLILDNVNDPADIASLLARAGTGRVIITSRLAAGWRTGTTVVRLDVLDPSESLALLTAITDTDTARDLDGAEELCAELGHLPLAVEQAAAYLRQNPLLTPRGYLRLLTENPTAMYDNTAIGLDPRRSIARVWRISLDRIAATSPRAADLLHTLAWYAPDDIPLTLCESLTDSATLHTAIGLLSAYNMITPDPATASISIHRLVQTLARTPDLTDPHRTPETIRTAHTTATTTLAYTLPDVNEPATWSTMRSLLPHIEALLRHSIAATDTNHTAHILDRTATYLSDQGEHSRAIQYQQRALTHRSNDDPNTVTYRDNLASFYRAAGWITDAIAMHEQTLTDRERLLGDQHPDTLTTRSNLASTYRAAGRISEAITLFERTVTDRERVLGDQHPDTLTTRNSLASTYQTAGRITEAITLYERNLTDRERVLGDQHPNTLISRNNLAIAYQLAGRITEAITLNERNLTDREHVLGDQHPNTLASRNNLAIAYQAAGRITEAITLHERNLTDSERVLGDQHPDTLISRHSLASAYQTAGRISEAITLHERNLTDRERVLGDQHPETLGSRNNLAIAYRTAGRITEAITLHERNLTDSERVLGDQHPDTLI